MVIAEGGLLGKKYEYLTSYKGLTFYAKSKERLELPPEAEVITADSIPMLD